VQLGGTSILSFLSLYFLVRSNRTTYLFMNILESSIEDHRKMKDGKYIQGCCHTSLILNHKNRNKAIIGAVCDLRKIIDDFDSIACCGTSGLMVVPQIAEILDKHIVIVRKNERSYSSFKIEGVSPYRYIIIDDLICSGSTIRHIKNSIKEEIPMAKCIGVYCYMPNECAYRNDDCGSKLCQRDLGIPLLNIA
jgi:adenine/guanine phosphoribosyltransferase-like PRPP-binding protein